MKKVLAILLPLAIILLAAACTTTVEVQFVSDAPEAAAEAEPAPEAEEPAEEELYEGGVDPAMMQQAQMEMEM